MAGSRVDVTTGQGLYRFDIRGAAGSHQNPASTCGANMWSLMEDFSWVHGYKKRYGFDDY